LVLVTELSASSYSDNFPRSGHGQALIDEYLEKIRTEVNASLSVSEHTPISTDNVNLDASSFPE
jgi:hypothetical protein